MRTPAINRTRTRWAAAITALVIGFGGILSAVPASAEDIAGAPPVSEQIQESATPTEEPSPNALTDEIPSDEVVSPAPEETEAPEPPADPDDEAPAESKASRFHMLDADSITAAPPDLIVSKTTNIAAAGESVTISGANYETSAGGFYVQVGWIAPTWRPSEGAAGTTRSSVGSYTRWVQAVNTDAPYAKWTDNGDGTVNFSYALTIDRATLNTKFQAGYSLAVFTVGAGGVVQAANELSVPISFTVPNPALSLSKTTALNPAGESVTISGTDFQTAGGGFYVQVGWIAPTWRPSDGAGAATRSSVGSYTRWVQATNAAAPYAKWTDNGDGTANFSYALTIDQATLNTKFQAGYTLAVFTVGAGGVVQAANELAVTIAFLGSPALVVSKTTALNPDGESLTISGTDFLISAGGFYVQVGWIAPTWRPSEGAAGTTRSSVGSYTRWVQAVNTDAPYAKWTDNGDGTANFSYPLTVDKATIDAKFQAGYTLAVFSVGAGGVVQADNELAVPLSFATAGTPTTPTGPTPPTSPTGGVSLSVSPNSVDRSVANTFTITGSGYTGAGAANGVYVSIGSSSVWQPGQVPGAAGWLSTVWITPAAIVNGAFSTTITISAGVFRNGTNYGVATFAAHELSVTDRTLDAWASIGFGGASTTVASSSVARTPADTPPATGGITSPAKDFTEGEAFTGEADGFQPGESGILVVIYSTPMVLDHNAVADPNGVVHWTGVLPVGLTGEHTLTFQGSVNRGIVLDIAAAEIIGCPVDDASLTWGFKESFRSYISGSIANGGWTVANGATYAVPDFGWIGGSGGYDAATAEGLVAFTGSVEFTGHDGALDTTIANPRLQFVDEDTAYLLLDISGTTQQGAAVQQLAVRFAVLDLSGAKTGGDTVTVTDAPAALTAEGAAAFGTYPEGEALDPVSFGFGVAQDCVIAVTDAAGALPSQEASPATDLAWIWWLAGVVLLAALIAAIVLLLVRRRRA